MGHHDRSIVRAGWVVDIPREHAASNGVIIAKDMERQLTPSHTTASLFA